jgi:hypothetical protein
VGRNHLFIGDHHRKPGLDNSDTVMIGELIEYLLPPVIWEMGDWYDMPSLSSWDVDKASFGQESLAADIEAGNAARAILNKHIAAAKRRNKRYDPLLIAIKGNHENRLNKLLSCAMYARFRDCIPAMDYTGWVEVPFLRTHWVDGIGAVHYLPYGRMGKPASSARNMHRWSGRRSVFAGHSHEADVYLEVDSFGKQTGAVQVGCSFTHPEDWNVMQHRFWRGVMQAVDVEDGSFGLDMWSFRRIQETL